MFYGLQLNAKKERGFQLLVVPLLIMLLLITGLPILQTLFLSFFSDSYGAREWIGLDGYRFILEDQALNLTINITVLWSFSTVSISLAAAYLLAERLYHSSKRSVSILMSLLIPWVVPIFISVPLWRALLYGNGGDSLISALFHISVPITTNPEAAFIASVIVAVWLELPFSTLIIFSNLKKINRSVADAASLDGCSRWHCTRYIYLPLLKEPLLIVGVLAAVGSFKEFSMMYMLTAGGPPLVAGITENFIVGATSTVGIFLYQIFQGINDFGITAVFGVFLTCGVAVIMLLWAALRVNNRRKRLILIIFYSMLIHIVWFRPIYAFLLPSVLLVFLGAEKLSWVFVNRKILISILFIVELVGMIVEIQVSGILQGFSPPILLSMLVLLTIPSPKMQVRHKLHTFFRTVGNTSLVSERFAVFFQKSGNLIFQSLQSLTTLFMGISSVLIVYMLIWLSFSRSNVCSFTGFFPSFPSAAAYADIFTEYHFGRAIKNTLLIALSTAVIMPFFAVPGAYGLARMKQKKSNRWLVAIQTIGTAGGIHTLIPLFVALGVIGLLDTRAAVIFLYVGHTIPKAVLVLKSFYQDIPETLYESAVIEGCGFGNFLKRILVPLSFPVILTVMMASFLGAWNGFLVPLLFLGSESKYPVSITLFRFVGPGDSGSPLWSLFAAASVLDMFIVGGLFLLVKKPFGFGKGA